MHRHDLSLVLPILPPYTEQELLAHRRDRMLPYEFYRDDHMHDVSESFKLVTRQGMEKFLIQNHRSEGAITRVMNAFRRRAWDYLAGLHVQYSAGFPLSSLQSFFPILLESWEDFAEYDKAFDETARAGGRKVPHLDLYDAGYWSALRLACFAIGLGYTHLLPRVAALWDYENDDRDGLLERLIAPYVPGRAAPPDTCTRHLPYFKTLKIFSAPPEQRPALMSRYLDAWYKASRREPYYDSHTQGRLHGYQGYWSFEAAAIVVELGIDDSSFRDKPFYPAEFADCGKQARCAE
ncbi:MAG: DUF1911 domain-containing protein [Pseudomonadales bacterium]|jgi:hypothetical protein|nr:DUF1911 domain-containing protein [Pseudomonadales bacterium]